MVLFGLGSFMVKVGLGMTLAGQAGNAVNWYKKNTSDSNKSCQQCGSANNANAKFCNSCGQGLQ